MISVPSGNFGNLVAGVMAWRLGAPIAAFSAPTTINDTVPRYLKSGRVEPRPSVPTLANAMDVGNPSNLERLQWLFGGDVGAMRSADHIDRAHRRRSSRRDRGAAQALRLCRGSTYRDRVSRHHPGTPGSYGTAGTLFLSTAHPAKFREVVEPAIGKTVPLPAPLGGSAGTKENCATHRRGHG